MSELSPPSLLQYLAQIVDSSDDAIVTMNLDGTITSWNRSAERMFGYTPAEAIGQSIDTIIPPELRADEAAVFTKVGSGEAVTHLDTVRIRKDVAEMIDRGLSNGEIVAELGKTHGPNLLRPHMLP